MSDLVFLEIPSEIFRQPLNDWQYSASEELSEALSLDSEGEEVWESLSANFAEEERESVELCDVPQDDSAVCVQPARLYRECQ